MSTPLRLLLPAQLHAHMVRHAQEELPNECCGLLAGAWEEMKPGRGARVERMYRLVNERTSPTEYFSEPRSMLAACQDIDRAGLEIVAVYHSHPTSPPVPSKKDIEQNYLGDVVHVIVSLDRSIEMRAWWLTDGIHEIAISTG